MSPRSLAEIRRQEIMEHFYAVVSEVGFDGASLARVASRMGVNPSLLLHYFGSRDQIVTEFVGFIIDRYEQVYINILKDVTAPEERLEVLMDRIFARDWGELVGDRAFYECYALSLSHPEIKEQFTTFYGKFRASSRFHAVIWWFRSAWRDLSRWTRALLQQQSEEAR